MMHLEPGKQGLAWAHCNTGTEPGFTLGHSAPLLGVDPEGKHCLHTQPWQCPGCRSPQTVPTSSMSTQWVPLPSSPGGQGPQRYPGYSYVSMQSTPLKQGLGLQRERCSWKPEERRGR